MSLRKGRVSDVMAATKNMSDAELRKELQKLGFTPGPVTDSTRGVLQRKLQNLKVASAKSERARKGQGSTRSRRSEPIRNKKEDWEEEEEEDDDEEEEESLLSRRTNVSTRPSRTLERKSYGGSGRPDREDERFSFDSRSPTSSHVRDTGLWRSDRSSLTGSHLTRGTAEYSDDLGYEHRSALGAERIPRTTFDSGSLGHEARSSLGGERFSRTTFDSGSLGHEARSSLGGERFSRTNFDSGSLGHEARSSLGGEMFPRTTFDSGSLGHEARSSLGGERFPRTTFDSGSLGHEARSSLGGERFPRTTYEYGSSGLEARSYLGGERFPRTTFDSGSLGSERFTRNLPESSSFPGQELRSRLTSERSSWSSLPLNRDEVRYRSKYEHDANDQHSYDNNSSRRYPAKSKPNWSRILEYYLSKLVKALSVGLFIVFFGILIMKSEIFDRTEQDDIKLIPPDCEGKRDKYCQAMQKQIILDILSELYNFLSLEAGSFECGNPSGLSSKCIPLKRAKEYVMEALDHAPEKFDSAIDWLMDRDEHLGIWAKGEDGEIVTSSSLVFCVESSRPHLGITCRLTNALYTAISNLFLALFGVFVLWLFLIYLRYHWRKLEEEEKQMFAMVEKIIDVVKLHYKGFQEGIEQNPYIGISHVRDMLIMPQDRKRLKKVWDRAVQFVKDNESRLRTESQRVAGADLLVWRWTQTRYEIPSERSSPTVWSIWSK